MQSVFSYALFIFSIFLNHILAQIQSVNLCYDIDMSGYAGGEDLIFCTKVLERIPQQLTPIIDEKITSKSARFGLRTIDLVGVFLPLNYFASVVQHEVFGHGYRIRDLGTTKARVYGYHFSWPPPYGDGSGTTYYGIHPKNITTNELACIFQAGIEAQNILAWQTKSKWLATGAVDPRQTVLFLVSLFALNLYASETDEEGNSFEGHDLTNYVEAVNATYPKSKLKVSQLRKLGLVNFLDITTIASIYGWTEALLYENLVKTWMIPIRNWSYLPSMRMGLSPFGPEFFFDNFLKRSDLIYFYLKAGNSSGQPYVGAGFWADRLFTFKQAAFSFRMDGWSQPELLLTKENNVHNLVKTIRHRTEKRSQGIAISTIIMYPNQGKACVIGEFGWKTKGFLPGYSLFNSPVVRVSISSRF